MKTKLNYKKFETSLYKEIDRSNIKMIIEICEKLNIDSFDFQWIFKFENGYGASVVKHYCSYGFDDDLFELAVIKFYDNEVWHLCYTTPITNNVIGYLTNDEVLEYLEKIKNLEEQ